MTPKLTAAILVGLSVCYGITIGILGALNSSITDTFAIIGALVLGALWVLRSLFHRVRST